MNAVCFQCARGRGRDRGGGRAPHVKVLLWCQCNFNLLIPESYLRTITGEINFFPHPEHRTVWMTLKAKRVTFRGSNSPVRKMQPSQPVTSWRPGYMCVELLVPTPHFGGCFFVLVCFCLAFFLALLFADIWLYKDAQSHAPTKGTDHATPAEQAPALRGASLLQAETPLQAWPRTPSRCLSSPASPSGAEVLPAAQVLSTRSRASTEPGAAAQLPRRSHRFLTYLYKEQDYLSGCRPGLRSLFCFNTF